jgi:hypothetical protein
VANRMAWSMRLVRGFVVYPRQTSGKGFDPRRSITRLKTV